MAQNYTASDFYNLLYHTDTDGNLPKNLYLSLFSPKYENQPPKVSWSQNTTKALEYAEKCGRDIHMQVALSDKPVPGGKRNNAQFIGEQCIAAFPAFFADVDCYKLYNNYKPGTIPKELRSIVELDELKPTAYINSGGGLHIWWIFDKLFITNTPEKRKYVSNLLARFGLMLNSMTKGTPIKFDSIFEIARVLRVIGSYNYKTSPPRQCSIIEFNPSSTYMIEQFDDICDVYTIPEEALSPHTKSQEVIHDIINETPDIRKIQLSPEEEIILNDKVEALCEANDEFSRAFACYGLTRQDSRVDVSNILQKLAYHAAAAAEFNLLFSDTEIHHIFKIFINKHGVNDDYYQDKKRITRIDTFVKPTIKKARLLASEHMAVNELKALSEKPREKITGSDLKKIYDTIKRLHNFSLLSFTKMSDGSYEILTENGLITVPNTETLGDQKKLQLRFMECINTTFQPIKSDSFRHTLNMMFSIMQTKLSAPEKDLSQQARPFIIDYILQSNDMDQTAEDLSVPEKTPESKQWKILLEVFVKWLKQTHGVMEPAGVVAQSLLKVGAERAQGRFHGIRRHYWIMPEDLTTEIDMILEARDVQLGG